MEKILKELMNTKCISMHDSNYRCYNKGCDGQCAQFQIALEKLKSKNTDWLEKHVYFINDSGVCLDFSEFKEAKESIKNL